MIATTAYAHSRSEQAGLPHCLVCNELYTGNNGGTKAGYQYSRACGLANTGVKLSQATFSALVMWCDLHQSRMPDAVAVSLRQGSQWQETEKEILTKDEI